jgi:hypothetical protein
MLISTALLLDSIIRNSGCTPAKLPCRPGWRWDRRLLKSKVYYLTLNGRLAIFDFDISHPRTRVTRVTPQWHRSNG